MPPVYPRMYWRVNVVPFQHGTYSRLSAKSQCVLTRLSRLGLPDDKLVSCLLRVGLSCDWRWYGTKENKTKQQYYYQMRFTVALARTHGLLKSYRNIFHCYC